MSRIEFWDETRENFWLSNFYPAAVQWENKKWPTSEHLYQGLKLKKPEDIEKIRCAKTPDEAKALSHKIGYTLDTVAKAALMRTAILAKSLGQNIPGGVAIPVMLHTATWTNPAANLQRQLVKLMPAIATQLGTWKELANYHQLFPITRALVFKHRPQHPKRRITHRLRQTAISDHALNVQVLILAASYEVFVKLVASLVKV